MYFQFLIASFTKIPATPLSVRIANNINSSMNNNTIINQYYQIMVVLVKLHTLLNMHIYITSWVTD